MLKLIKKTITFKSGDNTVNIFLNPYTNEKNKNLRGFANVSILTEDNKMSQQFNNLQVVEGKKENIFLVEPQENFKDKEGKWANSPIYLMKRTIKDDLAFRIVKEAIER